MPLSDALRVSGRFPLSRTLVRLFAPKRRVMHPSSMPHANVISPPLCDDILNLLGPSLVDYQGCDIIDLHPGPCVWSKKLHNALRPRCHLLMEPDNAYYEPFIKPLLDAPDSTYKHTNLSGAHPRSYWSVYKDVFNDDLLPKRPAMAPDDPALRQPDRSLLITGAIFRDYKDRKIRNGVNSTMLILNQMIHAAQLNTMFHSHGLVRMLFWVPEQTRDQLSPRSLRDKSAINFAIDSVASMTEVAAVPRPQSTVAGTDRRARQMRLRANLVEDCSVDMARDRMLAKNITIPERRQTPALKASLARGDSEVPELIKRLSAAVPTTQELDTPTKISTQIKQFAADVDDFIQDLATHQPDRYGNFGVPTDPPSSTLADEPHFRMRFPYDLPDEASNHLTDWMMSKHTPFAALDIRQVALEKALPKLENWRHARTTKPPNHDSLRQTLIDTASTLRGCHDFSLGAHAFAKGTLDLLEEERGLASQPAPLLSRDQRPYEPLMTSADEFWPRTPLCLFDIQPRPETLASDITSAAEGNAVMRDLAQTIMIRSRENVVRALDRLAPNAGRDLIQSTPELHDVRAGGRLDMRDLSVRMLTTDMFKALVRSFLEWPFRPTTAELAVSMQEYTDLDSAADEDGEDDSLAREAEDMEDEELE